MKTLLKLFALVPLIAQGAVEYDFSKGIDLSGKTSVTPYQLNTLVDSASLRTNKGLVISQSTTPDVANNPRYTNYLWLDLSTTPAILKQYTTGTWASASIPANSIITAQLQDSVITGDKLATNAVFVYHINDNSITASKIAASQVTESKIGSGAIITSKIYAGAVGTTEITNQAVTTAKLADAGVTAAKLAPAVITSAYLAAGSVQTSNLTASSVNASNLMPATITASQIAGRTLQSTNIAFNAVTTNELAATITAVLPNSYVQWNVSGSTVTMTKNLGFASATYNSSGNYTFAFSSARSSTNYIVSFTPGVPKAGATVYGSYVIPATGSITVIARNASGGNEDTAGYMLIYPE